MTTITEDFWDQDELTVPSPFSPLESFPDSDSTSNSEYEVEEESLFSSEAQDAQEQFAYALESALTEALAKYSVTHTKTQNTESATSISTIGEFWNGCVDDIEIDEEISSLEDEIYTIAAEIETFKGQNHLIADAKTFLSAPIIIPSKTQDIKRAPADLSLPVRIISSDGPIPPPLLKSVKVVELKETKTRKTKTKQPKPTKSKKRKADEKEILIDESPVTKKLNNSKQNTRKKSSLRSSTALKEVFKLEQVLKIKSVDQDSENEEVDIGDSTDCVCI